MKQEELNKVLELHKKWLNNEEEGQRANLTWANLSGADLSLTNLSGADLSDTNLTWANLSGADLSETNLSWANLTRANLTRANLTGANLTWANLTRANLTGANLSWANLTRANLSGADLDYTNIPLKCTSLGIIIDERIIRQWIYHLARMKYKGNDEDILSIRQDERWIRIANKFHRGEECGMIGGKEK